ncbi:MAG: DNA-binding MarR family transcriptional regulator [Halieaceae bacterium]|jgi:DNA-binding MarR family transcriptional regulator
MTPTTTTTTRARALIDLWLTNERVSVRIDHTLGAIHGLGYVEFMVLNQLAKSPAGRMRRVDLAYAIGRTASGVTRLLKPMEKIGLVSRDDSHRDARVSLVALTGNGRTRLDEAMTTMNDIGERILQPVGDAQLDSLIAALRVLQG